MLRRAGQATRKLLKREFGLSECDRIWAEVHYKKEGDLRKVNLSAEGILRLLDVCTPDRFRAYILTMIFTGANRRVLLDVRKRDLSIIAEGGDYRGTIYLEDRKTGGRARSVGLSHRVSEALVPPAHHVEQNDPVFGYGYHFVGKRRREVRQKAGYPELRMKRPASRLRRPGPLHPTGPHDSRENEAGQGLSRLT